MVVWDDELSGVRVEWQKHAAIAAVGADGMVQSGYAVGRVASSGRPLTKMRYLRDQAQALELGRDLAQSFHAKRFNEAFSGDSRYQCDELGLEVSKVGDQIVIDFVVRGYARTWTSRLAEVQTHAQAADLIAKLYLEAADMKWQLSELGRNGEFPADAAKSLIDIQRDFDINGFMDRRILGMNEVPADGQKAAREAVQCRLHRWLWNGPLAQALSYGITRAVHPYKIRRVVMEVGEYHHPALSLSVRKLRKGGWALVHTGTDGREVVIGRSKKPDWAASVIGLLDRRCEDAKVDIFGSVLREEVRAGAETPLAVPGFSDWLASSVSDLEVGYGATAVLSDPDIASIGAGSAIIHALEQWMASDAFKEAIPSPARHGR